MPVQRRNPTCLRPGCNHLLKGSGGEGHFAMGSGPCKTGGCRCERFLATSRMAFGPVPPPDLRQEEAQEVGAGVQVLFHPRRSAPPMTFL